MEEVYTFNKFLKHLRIVVLLVLLFFATYSLIQFNSASTNSSINNAQILATYLKVEHGFKFLGSTVLFFGILIYTKKKV